MGVWLLAPPSQLYHIFSQAYPSKNPSSDFHCQSGSYFNIPQFALYLHMTPYPDIKRYLLGIQSCIYTPGFFFTISSNSLYHLTSTVPIVDEKAPVAVLEICSPLGKAILHSSYTIKWTAKRKKEFFSHFSKYLVYFFIVIIFPLVFQQ